MSIAGTQPLALDVEAHERLRRFYEDKIAQGHRIPLRPA